MGTFRIANHNRFRQFIAADGDFAFRSRLPELREARGNGAIFPTVCVLMDHFIGDFDADRRRDAIANMKSLLSVIAELGGSGAITPASYGMHSSYLPPFTAPRDPAGDRAVLLEGLRELGDHAAKEGVTVLFEPLNRYEDHMVNTLARGVSILDKLSHPSVKLMADLFHMSIEETDLSGALEEAFAHVAHIHVADTNRYEPGEGHTDFAPVMRTLERLDFQGFLALECMLRKEPAEALKSAVDALRTH